MMDPLWINTAIDYEVLCVKNQQLQLHIIATCCLSVHAFPISAFSYLLQVTDSRVKNSEASQTWLPPKYI